MIAFFTEVLHGSGHTVEWCWQGRTWLDLAAAGLAFDVVGAWFLALGVLLRPSEVFSITHQLDSVFSPDDAERVLARETLQGFFGLSFLVLGFGGQLAAVILSQAHSPGIDTHRSVVLLLTAVITGAAAAALSQLAIRLLYDPFLRRSAAIRTYLYRRRWESLPRIGDDVSATQPVAVPTDAEIPGAIPARVRREIVPATVEALLENARALADDEDARGASLKQRAGWLLGFLGVMLTVLLTQVRALSHSRLGDVGTPLASAFALVALVLILGSAWFALKTLSVVKLWHVEPSETNKYPTYGYVARSPEDIRGVMLRGWVRQFADERPANNAKAGQLQAAFRLLLLGFAALTGLAATLLARSFGF